MFASCPGFGNLHDGAACECYEENNRGCLWEFSLQTTSCRKHKQEGPEALQ